MKKYFWPQKFCKFIMNTVENEKNFTEKFCKFIMNTVEKKKKKKITKGPPFGRNFCKFKIHNEYSRKWFFEKKHLFSGSKFIMNTVENEKIFFSPKILKRKKNQEKFFHIPLPYLIFCPSLSPL